MELSFKIQSYRALQTIPQGYFSELLISPSKPKILTLWTSAFVCKTERLHAASVLLNSFTPNS